MVNLSIFISRVLLQEFRIFCSNCEFVRNISLKNSSTIKKMNKGFIKSKKYKIFLVAVNKKKLSMKELNILTSFSIIELNL